VKNRNGYGFVFLKMFLGAGTRRNTHPPIRMVGG